VLFGEGYKNKKARKIYILQAFEWFWA